jgi:voltage-gated potassium channel
MASQEPSACSTDKLPQSNTRPLDDASDRAIESDVSVTSLDRWLGPAMYWVSIYYLALAAGILIIVRDAVSSDIVFYVRHLAILYPLFIAETIAHVVTGGRCWWRNVLYCVCPPLRLGGRDHVDGRSVWLPRIGWARVDQDLVQRVERAFSVPMILFALLVLPILGFEFYWMTMKIEPSWQMSVLLKSIEAVIWYAFAVEFIIMVSIVPKKLRYCRQHWIDIAIICLPLISFLRMLRLGRVLRLQQVSRVARVYRLRGLSMRMFRGILVLDIIHRLMEGKPEKRLPKLREQLAEKETEIEQLRAEIAELEALLEESKDKSP